ncbi:hypothetical protein SBA2_630005 [Acidobacteriia bacterium SbA2]|nr:hypothetical protein SBA2_630005 [Acidobacteriia bacterium SbA2]
MLLFEGARFGGDLVVVIREELLALGIEDSRIDQAHSLQAEFERCGQHAQAVFHATTEVDRGGFREISRRARYLSNAVVHVDDLGQDFVVKNEVVGILFERQASQDLRRKSPVAGVILGQLEIEQQILEESQESVGDVLIERHSAL